VEDSETVERGQRSSHNKRSGRGEKGLGAYAEVVTQWKEPFDRVKKKGKSHEAGKTR